MKFGCLMAGDMFQTHNGTTGIKLANGTAVDAATWVVLTFAWDVKVTWKGKLQLTGWFTLQLLLPTANRNQ